MSIRERRCKPVGVVGVSGASHVLYFLKADTRVLLVNLDVVGHREDDIQHRIVPFDAQAATVAAGLMAQRQRTGRIGDLRDTMIAGIVIASHAMLATRNMQHFDDLSVPVVDPWSS